jgi:hypothetical protein
MVENRHIRRIDSRQHCRDLPRYFAGANPLIVLIALLALTIQLFVVQTHVHGSGFASGTNFQPVSTGAAHPDGFPVKDDPSNCPLCQEFAHAGGILHSTQYWGWVPAFTIVSVFRFGAPVPMHLRVSHSWFGRAPPRTTVQS